jgi:MinD superfamily P-loop ATPase
VLLFPELCHGCAGCWLVCPTGAITESYRVTGQLELGESRTIQFVQGLLNIGEAMSPPLIRQVKYAAPLTDLLVIDSPPGTSCPVIESMRDADFVLLVTEPTPFGLNDLKLAVEVVRALKLPLGVVINRADVGDNQTLEYCSSQRIDVLAEIPDDRRVAEAYSRGEMACEALPQYRRVFSELLEKIENIQALLTDTVQGRTRL